MRTPIAILLAATIGLSGCAPSPYYVAGVHTTPGEIPRDTYGVPVWVAIPAAPPAPAALPPPPPPVPVLPIPHGAGAASDVGVNVPLAGGARMRAGAAARGAD